MSSINTEQGKSQVTKVQQEIMALLVSKDRTSILSKVKSQVSKVQQEILALLVKKDRSSI